MSTKAASEQCSIEVFEGHGLRLVSTDSYVLARVWVPFDDESENLEPDVDEMPDETVLVSDADRRGLGLLDYMRKLYKKEEHESAIPPILLSREIAPTGDQGVFDGLEAPTLRLDWPDHELAELRMVEFDFPNWRKLIDDRREPTVSVSFTSRTLRAVAKIGELYAGHSIDWTLRGNLGVIDWTVGPVSGLLMPARPITTDAAAEGAAARRSG